MKKKDVRIGVVYRMHHTSGWIDVKIINIVERYTYGANGRRLAHWQGVNLKTGRVIEVKSASKLIREVEPGTEPV